MSTLTVSSHLEGKNHTFDSFVVYPSLTISGSYADYRQAYVASMKGLRDEEKFKARNLLKAVKKYEKPIRTSQGVQGSYVEAICSEIKPRDVKSDEPPVVFLCLPYFELAPLSKQSPSHSRGSHQPRTLLQYLRGLDQSPKGHCFHLSYLWCLVIGSGKPAI